MVFKNTFINYQDRLYIVKKTIKAKFNPVVEVWKEYLGADLALQQEETIYFVEAIPDLDEVEFLDTNTTKPLK